MNRSRTKRSAPEQVNKENYAGATAQKKGRGGSSARPAPGAAKPKAKKPQDPAKCLLRLPSPTTMRKEAHADEDAISNTDPKAARKFGKEQVKFIHQMVDADWHDGWYEQGEAVFKYFKAFEKFVQGVFDMAVMDGVAFERCHEVMKALADSWQNMLSIPFRLEITEQFDDIFEQKSACANVELGQGNELLMLSSPMDVFARFWPLLLWAAASSSEIEDDLLYRWIKDASDYDADLGRGGELWKLVARQKEVKNEAGEVTRPANEPTLRAKKSGMKLSKGIARLIKLHANRSQWEDLKSCKKNYRTKRALDRRFDGPKDRRTRDYSSDSSDDYDKDYGDY